jgi:hypothetical protein
MGAKLGFPEDFSHLVLRRRKRNPRRDGRWGARVVVGGVVSEILNGTARPRRDEAWPRSQLAWPP